MSPSYDIFEITADGAPLWRCVAEGRQAALKQIEQFATTSPNELVAVNLRTGEILTGASPVSDSVATYGRSRDVLLEMLRQTMKKDHAGMATLGQDRRPAVESNRGVAPELVRRCELAIVNCYEMHSATVKMLNQNRDLINGVRQGMENLSQNPPPTEPRKN